jgi:hypothetical protein
MNFEASERMDDAQHRGLRLVDVTHGAGAVARRIPNIICYVFAAALAPSSEIVWRRTYTKSSDGCGIVKETRQRVVLDLLFVRTYVLSIIFARSIAAAVDQFWLER